jgi:Domain of unknown function (DUF3854)
MATLTPEHLAQLREGSGISDEVIAARGYQSLAGLAGYTVLKQAGFSNIQAHLSPGLLLPVWTPDGQQPLAVYRPDNPRLDRKRQRPLKYELPKGAGVRLDCPPPCLPLLADPAIPLWVTEGQKKADCLASLGACVLDVLGVWNFMGKNAFGGIALLADFDYVAWNGREVRVCFDADVWTLPGVRQALDRLSEHLRRKGATVRAVYLPKTDDIKGVDDFIMKGKHTLADLEALIEAPRPQPQPAPDLVRLLRTAPLSLRKPLALLNGKAYAAIWPYVEVTHTEGLDKQGKVVRLPQPQVSIEQRSLIVQEDGRLFGEGGDAPVSTLGLAVHLPEIPQQEQLWSVDGLEAYRQGYRPDPRTVYQQVCAVVDRFLDFDRSLVNQQTMCEMVACYILSTWLLDAFTVVGFVWPHGEWGSGKTKLLHVVAELGYLGQVVLAGGSYATLRDLADYGATLAFDDAENLSDPRKCDPDKRTLLLAGNRKGNVVPVKEPGPNGTWRTRYVHTYCPRLFSATRLPDQILASRTIIVPLVRTANRDKANADPLDYSLWPHEKRAVTDDLWALALANLAALPPYEKQVNTQAGLLGRNLEPWRALLSVALWLQDQGAHDLYTRLETLARDYTQKERPTLEYGNLTYLLIRALFDCTGTSISSIPSISSIKGEGGTEHRVKPWMLPTADITAAAMKIAQESELDMDPDAVTTRRIGRHLARLRLKKDPDTSKRAWEITLTDLTRLALSFGLVADQPNQALADKPPPVDINACNACDAGNACPDHGCHDQALADTPTPHDINACNAWNAGNAWDADQPDQAFPHGAKGANGAPQKGGMDQQRDAEASRAWHPNDACPMGCVGGRLRDIGGGQLMCQVCHFSVQETRPAAPPEQHTAEGHAVMEEGRV